MVAFPPHLQLAFPIASELALSACTYGLRFGNRFRLHFLSALRFRVISFARGCCVSAYFQSDSTLPFSSAWLTCVKSVRYGCLSLSITSVSTRAYSMLTACIGRSIFDCDSLISSLTAASIPILSSHAGRTFTDIIVTLRLRSSALRSIPDTISAVDFSCACEFLSTLRRIAVCLRILSDLSSFVR
jgi:hypothetical protein